MDEPGILDMDWGDWTGRSFAEVSEKYPELYRTCFDRPSAFSAPGGQSFEQLRAQSVATIKAIVERHDGEAVAIVTHTVNIRLILIGCLEMPTDFFWRIRQGTCAINALESEAGLFYLRVINDTCHTRAMPGRASRGPRPRRPLGGRSNCPRSRAVLHCFKIRFPFKETIHGNPHPQLRLQLRQISGLRLG